MENKKRDISLEIMRILACVMVVGAHTAMEGWYNISPRTYTWTVLNFYDTVCRPSLPIFIMISGSLFLAKEKIDIKRLWLKNILHLAVIYLIWAVFYAVTTTGIKKTIANPKVVWEIVFGPNPQYHLWYLRALINIYAISPLLWLLVHSMDRKHFRYFCILFFIFGLLKSTVYELPFIPAWLHDQINLFVEMDLVRYTGYFMLGYFLSTNGYFVHPTRKKLWMIYLPAMVLAAALNQLIAVIDDWPTQALYGTFAIPVAIEAVCIFLLIRSRYDDYQTSSSAEKMISKISKSTLFVYLIHPFVIQRLQIYFNLYTTNYNVLVSVPVMVLLVFCLSSAAGMVLNKIPVINKIL